MSQLEKRLEYLQAVVDSQLTPSEVMMIEEQKQEKFVHVDVRIAPSKMKGNKILGALEIPLNELMDRIKEIPSNRSIIVSTWGAACTLAKNASIILLKAGFEVKELSGGVSLWEEYGLPTEPSTYL